MVLNTKRKDVLFITFILLTLFILFLLIYGEKNYKEKVYRCHKGHVFKSPQTKIVMDYDGFDTEIQICPECGCDEAFYKEIQLN